MIHRPLLLPMLCTLMACGASDAPEAATTNDSPDPVIPARPIMLGTDTVVRMDPLRCDDGGIVSARYLAGSVSRVSLILSDTTVDAPAAVAASGSRYANADESLVWWSKGDSATLTWRGRTTACVVDSTVEF